MRIEQFGTLKAYPPQKQNPYHFPHPHLLKLFGAPRCFGVDLESPESRSGLPRRFRVDLESLKTLEHGKTDYIYMPPTRLLSQT